MAQVLRQIHRDPLVQHPDLRHLDPVQLVVPLSGIDQQQDQHDDAHHRPQQEHQPAGMLEVHDVFDAFPFSPLPGVRRGR